VGYGPDYTRQGMRSHGIKPLLRAGIPGPLNTHGDTRLLFEGWSGTIMRAKRRIGMGDHRGLQSLGQRDEYADGGGR